MRKTKYTQDQVAEALRVCRGLISLTAERLKCDRATVYNYLQRWPELVRVVDDARARLIDLAELKLEERVMRGEAWAVCFVLKCLAKDRGYVERQHVVHEEGGQELKINERIVTARLPGARPYDPTTGNGASAN